MRAQAVLEQHQRPSPELPWSRGDGLSAGQASWGGQPRLSFPVQPAFNSELDLEDPLQLFRIHFKIYEFLTKRLGLMPISI